MKPKQQSTVDLHAIYTTQDTVAFRKAVISDHQQVRRLLDKQLSAYIKTCADADSHQIDSLTTELSWLCQVYTTLTHCVDKKNRLQLYRQWSSDIAARKQYLDSIFLAEHVRYKKTPDSIKTRQRAIYLRTLKQLFRDYYDIDDKYQSASVAFYIGRAFYDAGQADSCLYYLNQCRTLSRQLQLPDVMGDCELWLGYVYNLHYADYLKAQEAILEAESLFTQTGKYQYRTYAQIQRLHVLRNLYQTDQVIDGFHAFLQDSSIRANKQLLSYTLYSLGEAFYDLGALDSAEYYAKQSYGIRRTLAETNSALLSDVAYSMSLRGLIAQARFDISTAEKQYDTADYLFRQTADTNGLCMNYLRMSSLLLERGDYKQAEEYYRFVSHYSDQFEDSLSALYGQAVTDYLSGNREAAIPRLQRGIAKLESTRNKLPIPEMKTGMVTDKAGFYHLLANIYFEKSIKRQSTLFLDSAFYMLEQSKARALVDNLQSPVPGKCQSDEIALIEQIAAIDGVLLTQTNDSSGLFVTRKMLRDSLDAVRVRHAVSGGEGFINSGVVSLQEVRSTIIQPETIIIEFLVSDAGCFLLAITTDTIKVVPLSIARSQLETTVRTYINAINHYPTVRDTAQEWHTMGKLLYKDLLPEHELNLSRYTRLLIVPSGILYHIPFATLLDTEDRFLIETHEISYIPSLTILSYLLRREDSVRCKKYFDVIAFGNPTFADSNITPLPFSKKEIQAIEEIFGNTAVQSFLDTAATRVNFISTDFMTTRYLHIATHGYSDNYRPDRSSLLFSQNNRHDNQFLLTAPRIASLTIPVELVFLSSCRSGSGKLYPGEGVLSLAQPFLVAGANTVVGTVWNVDDRSSVEFVRHFYRALAEGHSKVRCLAQAQRAQIASRYRHPYYWGSYLLIGIPD